MDALQGAIDVDTNIFFSHQSDAQHVFRLFYERL